MQSKTRATFYKRHRAQAFLCFSFLLWASGAISQTTPPTSSGTEPQGASAGKKPSPAGTDTSAGGNKSNDSGKTNKLPDKGNGLPQSGAPPITTPNTGSVASSNGGDVAGKKEPAKTGAEGNNSGVLLLSDFWRGFWNISAAFAIGSLGAWAFYFGVYIGLIARTDRPSILQFLQDEAGPNNVPPAAKRFHYRLYYGLFGGVIAAVFQAAQWQTIAPIQALVLGATWYSVITNIMTGSQPKINPSDIVDGVRGRPQGVTGTARDAEAPPPRTTGGATTADTSHSGPA